ncbi:hypothetical protein U8P73_29105 (plasmid) [Rhizobium beringeri]|uniref:hypothetical protein n=1 Tax=Rhizobium beringeri TaxID=3019934 RepID=UPI002DDD6F8E|nr:hypothetical protein [Rhizobium beringeri]WSG92364.1 hypothetical protein U8P73_29105 [Rhizobium beringeri]
MNLNDDDEHLIETLFRNGTITVVGVVLSFSLGFLTQWASNPIPWRLADLPTLVVIIMGIVFQLRSLALLLQTSSLKKSSTTRQAGYF